MSITTRIWKEHNLTVQTVKGSANYSEVRKAWETFYSEQRTDAVLWDLRKGTLADLSLKDLYKLTEFLGDKPIEGKKAFLTTNSTDLNIGLMLDTFLNLAQAPVKLKVFEEESEALIFLGLDKMQKVEELTVH